MKRFLEDRIIGGFSLIVTLVLALVVVNDIGYEQGKDQCSAGAKITGHHFAEADELR